MDSFTPVSALIGGGLIGLSALLLWLLDGRIAGISGIIGGLGAAVSGDVAWRVAFLVGLIGAPLLYRVVAGAISPITISPSPPLLIVAGLLVGFGTRLAGGCTSGHGVCGLARLSPRSAVATMIFMAAGFITVFVTRHLVGS